MPLASRCPEGHRLPLTIVLGFAKPSPTKGTRSAPRILVIPGQTSSWPPGRTSSWPPISWCCRRRWAPRSISATLAGSFVKYQSSVRSWSPGMPLSTSGRVAPRWRHLIKLSYVARQVGDPNAGHRRLDARHVLPACRRGRCEERHEWGGCPSRAPCCRTGSREATFCIALAAILGGRQVPHEVHVARR